MNKVESGHGNGDVAFPFKLGCSLLHPSSEICPSFPCKILLSLRYIALNAVEEPMILSLYGGIISMPLDVRDPASITRHNTQRRHALN